MKISKNNGSNDVIEKLAFLYFVNATQASYICTMLWTHPVKKEVMFFHKLGGNECVKNHPTKF